MNRDAVVAIGLTVLLGGCADGTSDTGTVPPVTIAATQRQITVPYQQTRSSALRLRSSIDMLAEGNVQAVHARVFATSGIQARRLRQLLIGMGLDPTRVSESIAPAANGSEPNIILSRATAITTDCAAAIAPSYMDDPAPSLLSLSRCTQNNNLANMVVDPADLVAPPTLDRASGADLANSVQAWRRRTSSPNTAKPTGNDDAGASSAAPTTTPASPPAGPATQAQ